jgi:RNA polymerase sigma-70 factor (ECF subfamily)
LQGEYSDQEILKLLQDNSDKAIDILFRQYYGFLCHAVYKIIPDTNLVEDIAQDVFYELWRKRSRLSIKTSLKAYLRRAAMNKALNFIRDQKIKFDDEEKQAPLESKIPSINQKLEAAELQQLIDKVIDDLPERCRIVFVLSRFEELSYNEIAKQLDISSKTVENQISKALKILRVRLGDYLNLFFILLSQFF